MCSLLELVLLAAAMLKCLSVQVWGKITIVDRDYVDWSNLQRQQLYEERDAEQGLPKAIAARNRLSRINSEVEITTHVLDLTPDEINTMCEQRLDVMIDATDNFETRLLINDASQAYNIPWVFRVLYR
ncbi:hypothetical protein GCM10020331_030380 [Ectobacillus funiculus]